MARGGIKRLSRDSILFGVGIVFATNEVLIRRGAERPYILTFIATLLGTPLMLRLVDRKRASNGSDTDGSSSPG